MHTVYILLCLVMAYYWLILYTIAPEGQRSSAGMNVIFITNAWDRWGVTSLPIHNWVEISGLGSQANGPTTTSFEEIQVQMYPQSQGASYIRGAAYINTLIVSK